MKYFTENELKCKGSGGFKLAHGFAEAIDNLRAAWNKPLVVNSCCRSAQYNKKVGGHQKSLHVYDKPARDTGGTCAIDFREHSEEFRRLAWDMGFSLGLGNNFTHCDTRKEVLGMPQVKFHY